MIQRYLGHLRGPLIGEQNDRELPEDGRMGAVPLPPTVRRHTPRAHPTCCLASLAGILQRVLRCKISIVSIHRYVRCETRSATEVQENIQILN